MVDSLQEYYDEMLQRFGPNDPRALAWRDKKSQQDRFKILSEVGNMTGKSVLDEGCGLGDFYAYLQNAFGSINYTGVDINERLITAARAKYPGTRFELSDFSLYTLEPIDYALASGTFTFRVPNHIQIYFGQIKKMYEASRIATAFNFLNADNFEGNRLYATYTLSEMYDFCRSLTDKITVRDDYSSEDYTLYLYK